MCSNYESQNKFYGYFAQELIDNTHDDSRRSSRRVGNPRRKIINDLNSSPLINNDGSGRCGLSIYLTPTKRKIINVSGKVSYNALQRRCNICFKKTTLCCSKCEDDDDLEKSIF